MENRIGMKLIKLAQTIRTYEPLIVCVLMLGIISVNTFAQTPAGSLFGSDAQIGNILREVINTHDFEADEPTGASGTMP